MLVVASLLLTVLGSAAARARALGRLGDVRTARAFADAFPDSESLADNPAPPAAVAEKTKATIVSTATQPNSTPTAGGSVATATPAIVPCPCGLRPDDQIWLISTRCLGCPAENVEPAYEIWRFDGAAWQSATLAEFLAADNPALPTDFYIHGNFETAGGAQENGLTVYRRLVACAPSDRSIRFVIWSWPSDPGHHKVQLIREHACRADVEAWYLGWLLNRMNPRVPLGIVGYSFGARVTTGALHLLGGGEMFGMRLAVPKPAPQRSVQVVLLAAAEDCYTLYPGQANGNALSVVERMLLLENRCDQALRLYPHLDPCCPAEALGYVGLGGNYPHVAQFDVCCTVGKKHDWRLYFCNECLVAMMRPYLHLEPSAPLAAVKRAGVALASAVGQCLSEGMPLFNEVKLCVRESLPLAGVVGEFAFANR